MEFKYVKSFKGCLPFGVSKIKFGGIINISKFAKKKVYETN